MRKPTPLKVLDRDTVGVLASPLGRELIAALDEPDSAASLARRFEMSRQRIGYHMRGLEKAGCIELSGQRQQRGLTERLYRARPLAYVYAPKSRRPSPSRKERYSWTSLVNLLSGSLWDLVRLRTRADPAGKHLTTLALDTEVSFASSSASKTFTEDLLVAIRAVIRKHETEHRAGRSGMPRFRLVLGAYPSLSHDHTPERHTTHAGRDPNN